LFFTRGIFSYHKKLYGADSEKIQSIDVCFREISSGTRTGAYAPYLKAADLEFTGITILKSPLELFDQEEVYRFYFSSQSKVLLAVEETQS
jgi:hypothetical protein